MINGLNTDDNKDNRIAAIRALGMLKYSESCSLLATIIKESEYDDEKLHAIISLGVIGDSRFKNVLIEMLEYEEPNIRWDAAISLAKMNDKSGAKIIANLLDRNYYSMYPP